MVSKVNGIKIYPKHSLGSTLCAAFYVFAGFMIVFGLSFFPILSATINGTVMRATGLDYVSYAFENSSLSSINFFSSLTGITHFLNPKKYSAELFNIIDNLKANADGIGNIAVRWYGGGSQPTDMILAFTYLLLMIDGLFMLVDGIIRLSTGTYPKRCALFTGIAVFLLMFFCISSFITSFCLKYIAKEAMPAGETYVSNACPLQYVVWGLVFACWIAEFWVFALLIRGKLYVAEARLMKGGKEPEKVAKRTKKEKKEAVVEEPVKEEVPRQEPAPEEPAPEPAPSPVEEAPAAEPTPEAKAEPENNEKKD